MMTSMEKSPPFKKVVIVGAGFSGIAMAYQLRHALKCDDFVIYDRGGGFGGTWLANTCKSSIVLSEYSSNQQTDESLRPRMRS